MTIKTDADSWNISNKVSDGSYYRVPVEGKNSRCKSECKYRTIKPRIDTLVITAGNANPVKVIVSQASSEYLIHLKQRYPS